MLSAERDSVVAFARKLRADGLAVGTAGNLSVRRDDLVAITPSGVDYDALTPEAVVVVDLEGRKVDGERDPSTELPMHLAAYRSGEAGAVVHAHPVYATVLGTVLDELPPVHYLVATLGGRVPVVAYATPGSEELASRVASALDGRRALLLRNHGTLTIGPTLERAYSASLTLEWISEVYHRARSLGEPSLLDDEELDRVARLLADYG